MYTRILNITNFEIQKNLEIKNKYIHFGFNYMYNYITINYYR